MPFDAMVKKPDVVTQSPMEAKLAKIGITPVPPQVMHAHQQRVKDEFLRNHPYRRSDIDWVMLNFRPMSCRELRQKLTTPLPVMTNDLSAAPSQLVKLAERVTREVKEAAFSVSYFYTDPILLVRDDQSIPACLGIWDHGVLIAIADQTVPTGMDAFRKLVDRVFGRG